MAPLPEEEVGEETGREDHICLYDEGNVYVTHSAAVRFAAQAGIPIEQARRFLTWFLLDAYQVEPAVGTRQALYRRRLGSVGWDVSARVVEDAEREGLMVVTSVSARPYRRLR